MAYNSILNFEEIKSKMDLILKEIECLKKEKVDKVYTTEQLCEYLGTTKSVINTYKRNGELAYSKVGRKYVFTQKDIDQFLESTKAKYIKW